MKDPRTCQEVCDVLASAREHIAYFRQYKRVTWTGGNVTTPYGEVSIVKEGHKCFISVTKPLRSNTPFTVVLSPFMSKASWFYRQGFGCEAYCSVELQEIGVPHGLVKLLGTIQEGSPIPCRFDFLGDQIESISFYGDRPFWEVYEEASPLDKEYLMREWLPYLGA